MTDSIQFKQHDTKNEPELIEVINLAFEQLPKLDGNKGLEALLMTKEAVDIQEAAFSSMINGGNAIGNFKGLLKKLRDAGGIDAIELHLEARFVAFFARMDSDIENGSINLKEHLIDWLCLLHLNAQVINGDWAIHTFNRQLKRYGNLLTENKR